MITLTRRLAPMDAEVTLTVSEGPVACLASLPSFSVQVPPGRWRLRTRLWADPEATAPDPAEAEVTVGPRQPVITSHALKLRVYRQFEGPVTVRFRATLERREGDAWTSAAEVDDAAAELPPIDPPTRSPLWGSALHIYLPPDRPPGSLDPFLDRMAGAGMQVVRTEVLWTTLEPTPGAFDPRALEQADAFFAHCAEVGIRPLTIVNCICPDWAAGDRPYVPRDWALYEEFARTCLDRWGAGWAAVLTQNEPNHPYHPEKYGPDDIVGAARAMTRAIDAAGLRGRVMNIGPSIAYGDAPYLATLLDAGLGEWVDGVAIQPYGIRFDIEPPHFREPERPWGDEAGDPNHLVSGAEVCRSQLQERGYSMPIWVTEFGLATSRTGPDGTLSGLDVTEEQQAAWLATAIRQAAAIPYIACFATYMLHDHAWADSGRWDEPHDNPANWQVRFGLVSWDNAREKPAWKAVTSTIASLPPPTEAG